MRRASPLPLIWQDPLHKAERGQFRPDLPFNFDQRTMMDLPTAYESRRKVAGALGRAVRSAVPSESLVAHAWRGVAIINQYNQDQKGTATHPTDCFSGPLTVLSRCPFAIPIPIPILIAILRPLSPLLSSRVLCDRFEPAPKDFH